MYLILRSVRSYTNIREKYYCVDTVLPAYLKETIQNAWFLVQKSDEVDRKLEFARSRRRAYIVATIFMFVLILLLFYQ